MTHPRIIVPGATFAITRRTTMRKAFLGDWDPRVGQAWLYALAEAQAATGVLIHATSRLPTHHHTLVTAVDEDALVAFMQRAHQDMSCFLNNLLRARGFDAPGEIFDDRPAHCLRLVDAGAQIAQTLYAQLQGPAAGLVERPEDMPGWTFEFGLWKRNQHVVTTRPDLYFGKRRPAESLLIFTPPPALLDALGDRDRAIYHMRRLEEEALEVIDAERTKPVMGAQAVLQIHPWDEPRTARETGGGLTPTFQIGARGAKGAEIYQCCVDETRDFRIRHHDARERFRAGDHTAVFPYGTYKYRKVYGATVEPAPEPGSAYLTAPGVLHFVGGTWDAEARTFLLDDVRATLRAESADEPSETRAPAPLRFDHGGALSDDAVVSTARTEERATTRDAVLTRHRFDPKPRVMPDAPRIVTLRDVHRRRPRRASDPPTD